MRHFEHRTRISATAESLWRMTVDVERWPQFLPTVASVRRLDEGELQVGSVARVKQPGQPERHWRVTVIESPVRFQWEADAKGFQIAATHLLERGADGGSISRLSIDLRGPLAGIVGVVAGRTIRRTLERENAAFRRAAENGGQEAGRSAPAVS